MEPLHKPLRLCRGSLFCRTPAARTATAVTQRMDIEYTVFTRAFARDGCVVHAGRPY
jgi:hypothetical protein